MFNSRLSRAGASMLAAFQDATSSSGTGGSAIRKALDMSNSASRTTSGRAAGMAVPQTVRQPQSSMSRGKRMMKGTKQLFWPDVKPFI